MKALIAVFLLVVIVGLTWVNYQRGQDKVIAGQNEVRKQSAKQVAAITSQADSLTTLLGAQQSAFGDSLIRKDSKYLAIIDSLEEAVRAREKQVADLKLAAKTKPKTAQTVSAPKKPTAVADATLKQHLEILSYYQNRFKTLPGDLSEYERKVAVREIRQETMDKFAITAVQLDRIRSDSNLGY
jgi:predicted RND superfamily exporter protein